MMTDKSRDIWRFIFVVGMTYGLLADNIYALTYGGFLLITNELRNPKKGS